MLIGVSERGEDAFFVHERFEILSPRPQTTPVYATGEALPAAIGNIPWHVWRSTEHLHPVADAKAASATFADRAALDAIGPTTAAATTTTHDLSPFKAGQPGRRPLVDGDSELRFLENVTFEV